MTCSLPKMCYTMIMLLTMQCAVTMQHTCKVFLQSLSRGFVDYFLKYQGYIPVCGLRSVMWRIKHGTTLTNKDCLKLTSIMTNDC